AGRRLRGVAAGRVVAAAAGRSVRRVAGVTDAVAVAVHLIRVRDRWAVVAGIDDSVAVAVGRPCVLLGARRRWRRAVVAGVVTEVDVADVLLVGGREPRIAGR